MILSCCGTHSHSHSAITITTSSDDATSSDDGSITIEITTGGNYHYVILIQI